MPNTMVQNIMGTISIVIILMNVLLIVCAVGAKPLKQAPTITPSTMPVNTWKVKLDSKRLIILVITSISFFGGSLLTTPPAVIAIQDCLITDFIITLTPQLKFS